MRDAGKQHRPPVTLGEGVGGRPGDSLPQHTCCSATAVMRRECASTHVPDSTCVDAAKIESLMLSMRALELLCMVPSSMTTPKMHRRGGEFTTQ